jgi:hypothetical protein
VVPVNPAALAALVALLNLEGRLDPADLVVPEYLKFQKILKFLKYQLNLKNR